MWDGAGKVLLYCDILGTLDMVNSGAFADDEWIASGNAKQQPDLASSGVSGWSARNVACVMNKNSCGGAVVNDSEEVVAPEQSLVSAEDMARSENAEKAGTCGEPGNSAVLRAVRRHLPDERCGITHKFSVGGEEGYVTVGLFEDGLPGEIFIVMSKEGSTVSGLMDSFATAVSLALQYGVPLKVLCDKFSHTRFEPSGWSGNPEIGYAKSFMDYLFRWLELRFLKGEHGTLFGNPPGVGSRQTP